MIMTLAQYKQFINTARNRPHHFTTITFKSIEPVIGWYKTSDENIVIVAVFYQNILLPMDIISDETMDQLYTILERDLNGNS